MTAGDGSEFRRLLPPPRRRPGLFAVAGRWRRELSVAVVVGAGAWALGLGVAGMVLGAVGVIVAAVPHLRRFALGALQSTVVPHRARAGFVEAGVGSRNGRLPWIVSARSRGDAVILSVWLPAGVTIGDVDGARGVLAGSCGAAQVLLARPGPRHDRVLLIVVRPRWGWCGP